MLSGSIEDTNWLALEWERLKCDTPKARATPRARSQKQNRAGWPGSLSVGLRCGYIAARRADWRCDLPLVGFGPVPVTRYYGLLASVQKIDRSEKPGHRLEEVHVMVHSLILE